jgi:hypothetical protein
MLIVMDVPCTPSSLIEFGKVDVSFAEDMVAGCLLLTSMIPSSLKKPGNMQRQRAAK